YTVSGCAACKRDLHQESGLHLTRIYDRVTRCGCERVRNSDDSRGALEIWLEADYRNNCLWIIRENVGLVGLDDTLDRHQTFVGCQKIHLDLVSDGEDLVQLIT